ncbi:MAG TPA: hypothetical protein VJT31_13745 [Rugosimonospora sp.]|nr:hypothetical protein [Rugosimonospora sp.]
MRLLRRGALAGLAATVAALAAVATPASAATPGAPYTGMGTCPLTNATMRQASNLQVVCFVSVTNSGGMTIGSHTVGFTSPITLQFGAYLPASAPSVSFPDGTSAYVYTVVPPTDGKVLTAAPIEVPIPGIVNLIPGVTSVYAQVLTAGPVTSFVPLASGEPYPILSMPIKIKLSGSLLGDSCYLGSDSQPIVLHPTSGTTNPPAPNKPVSGDPGSLALDLDPHGYGALIASYTGATLVDNSFAVPGATGCGLFGVLNGIVNSVFGLPSAAGNNTVAFGRNNSSVALDSTAADLASAIAAASS